MTPPSALPLKKKERKRKKESSPRAKPQFTQHEAISPQAGFSSGQVSWDRGATEMHRICLVYAPLLSKPAHTLLSEVGLYVATPVLS